MSVIENSAAGTAVTSIAATDADASSDGQVQYSMDSSNTLANTHFQIDATSGEITVKAPIDREQYASVR